MEVLHGADIAVEHQVLGQREQTQLDAGGKAARIGYVLGRTGSAAVELGQAIDKVVVGSLQAVVHREVDDAQLLGHVVALEELARVAIGRAEEEHVDFVQRQLVGKGEVGFAIEPLMHIGDAVSGIAAAVYKYDFCLRVVEQQANQFARCIACTTNDSYFNHVVSLRGWGNYFISSLWLA